MTASSSAIKACAATETGSVELRTLKSESASDSPETSAALSETIVSRERRCAGRLNGTKRSLRGGRGSECGSERWWERNGMRRKEGGWRNVLRDWVEAEAMSISLCARLWDLLEADMGLTRRDSGRAKECKGRTKACPSRLKKWREVWVPGERCAVGGGSKAVAADQMEDGQVNARQIIRRRQLSLPGVSHGQAPVLSCRLAFSASAFLRPLVPSTNLNIYSIELQFVCMGDLFRQQYL
jgi:hypothetical protein